MCENDSRDITGAFLKELLKKPAFKDDVRALLKGIEGPDTGRDLIRTFLWQDIELSLGLMAGLPVMANVLIRVFDEVLVQVGDKFSPDLLRGFMASLLDEIDKPALAGAIRKLRPMVDNLAPLFREAWQEVVKEGERS